MTQRHDFVKKGIMNVSSYCVLNISSHGKKIFFMWEMTTVGYLEHSFHLRKT